MRALIVGLAAFFSIGVAHADPYDELDYRATEHAPVVYFRVDFGAPRSSVPLRPAPLASLADGDEGEQGFWAEFAEGGWLWIVTGAVITGAILATGGSDPRAPNTGGSP